MVRISFCDFDPAPSTYMVDDTKSEKIISVFYKQELQKTKGTAFRIKKVIKTNGEQM